MNSCLPSTGTLPQTATVYSLVYAPHIEPPEKKFIVWCDHVSYLNEFQYEAHTSPSIVLARTSNGALAVMRYHYSHGSKYRLDSRPFSVDEKYPHCEVLFTDENPAELAAS